jgi:hypothetical protein
MDKFQFDEFVWRLRDEAGMSAADAQQEVIDALVKDAGFGSICGDREYGLFNLFASVTAPAWKPVIAGQEPKGRVMLHLRNSEFKQRVIVGEYYEQFEIECRDCDEDTVEYCDADGAEYLPAGWYADSRFSDTYYPIDDKWKIICWRSEEHTSELQSLADF